MNASFRLIIACVLFTLLGMSTAASRAHAQPELDKTKQSFDQSILGLFNRYCFRCHGRVDPSSEIDLQSDENPRMIADNAQLWDRVREQIETGAMPPEDKRQPNAEDRELLLEFLNRTLDQNRCGGELDPGVPSVRRLNHFEYNRCLSELLSLPIDIADDFPPDPNSFGFLNNAAALEMDPVLVTQYYGAAEQAIDRLIASAGSGNATDSNLFGADSDDPNPDLASTRERLIEFGSRAFRRPLAADDPTIDRSMRIYEAAIAQGRSHVEAMKYPLIAVLISPRFLVRAEADRPDQTGVYRVDDYDLASRLSFFLWSQGPDDELLQLAGSGKLSSDDRLRDQTRRMLRDAKHDGLLTGFFEQWLSISELESHPVDAATFPKFSVELKDSMRGEVRRAIGEIVSENRSILELIDADYLHIDHRLAELYGLPLPAGDGFAESGAGVAKSRDSWWGINVRSDVDFVI